jgi:hypothetical protein
LCISIYGETTAACWRTAKYACLKATRSSTWSDFSPIVPLPISLPSWWDIGTPIRLRLQIVCAEFNRLLRRPSLYHASFWSVSISNILPQNTHHPFEWKHLMQENWS